MALMMNKRAQVMLLGFVAASVFGCGDGGGDGPTDTGAGGTVGLNDAGGGTDASTSIDPPRTDGSITPDASSNPDSAVTPMAPAAPNVLKPAVGARTFFIVQVQGTAEPGASLSVRLLKGLTTVGSANTTVDSGGFFLLDVEYRGAAHMDELTVETTVRNDFGASMRRVTIQHWAPAKLTVQVSQSAGPTTGTEVVVRLYKNGTSTELPRWSDEKKITVLSGQLAPARQVVFDVATDATYFLRAFRDSSGAAGPTPDGQPTLGGDPQSGATRATVTGTTTQLNVNIVAPAVVATRYAGFNVLTNNESPLPAPPSARVGSIRKLGKGWCGGYHLDLGTERQGDGAGLSVPFVALPDLRVVELKDDGACSEGVRDNSGSSFDPDLADGKFRYGFPNPGPERAGRYVMAFRHDASDQIHIEVDEVATITKLPLLRELIFPSSATANTNLRPTLTWQPVPGAGTYFVLMQSGDVWTNDPGEDSLVNSPAYTPKKNLLDDRCYTAVILAFDANPVLTDTESMSVGSYSSFCTDVAGDSSVKLTGSITNNAQADVPIVIHVTSDDSKYQNAFLTLPKGSNNYAVTVLRGGEETGSVVAFLDRAGSGLIDSLENNAYVLRFDETDFRTNLTRNLVFNPPIAASTPGWFDSVGPSPRFAWSEYGMTAGSAKPQKPWSYVLWTGAESDGDGAPPAAYVMPASRTFFDMADPPDARDRIDLFAVIDCVFARNGAFSTTANGNALCNGVATTGSATSLQSDAIYFWTTNVIECDFSTLKHPAVFETDPFLVCMKDALQNDKIFASSAALPFVVAK
jgi:hypothetical protein